jgi:dipeptidyl aminopeptidase/acylaminoacyl peptidase
MKKTVLVMVTLAAAVLAAQPTSTLTPEQTLERRGLGELELSPDRARLVFTVTEPVKGLARQRHIWVLDIADGFVRQLTFSAKSDGSPRWAPDGRSIAFLSDRDGASQLYLLPMSGGEAEKITDRKESIDAFRWAPDGRHIALLMEEPKSDAQQKREKDKDDARVADKDDRLARIWDVDVTSRAIRQITTARFRIGQIEFAPGSDRLIVAASPRPDADQFNEAIFSVELTDGRFTPIATPRGPMGAMALSPDGRTIAYGCARVDGPEAHDLCLQPVAGGAMRNITGTTVDRPVNQLKWIDAQTIAAGVARGFRTSIEIVAAGDGRAEAIAGLSGTISAYARAPDGTVAFVSETAVRAPEVWLKTPAAVARAVTTFNQRWSSRTVIAPEFVKYKSADGTEIEAALLLPTSVGAELTPPARADQGRPLHVPTVILIHGGPTGRWADTFEPWGQLLAARGYAVLYPNVRGSTGYGQRFVEMNRADWGGGDFKDVMAGADWLVARGIADPNRLGIGGWSYGGYMAAWAVTQTPRFKAAVSGAPVIDMASEFGTENGSAYDEWFYGTPYEKLDGFIRSSPMTFVKNVKTPTLLLQGEDDRTDPIGQSQQFYRGLKRYGVDSDLVLYPREPHGLREEKHLVDRLTRILAWYDRYLKPAATSPTPQR